MASTLEYGSGGGSPGEKSIAFEHTVPFQTLFGAVSDTLFRSLQSRLELLDSRRGHVAALDLQKAFHTSLDELRSWDPDVINDEKQLLYTPVGGFSRDASEHRQRQLRWNNLQNAYRSAAILFVENMTGKAISRKKNATLPFSLPDFENVFLRSVYAQVCGHPSIRNAMKNNILNTPDAFHHIVRGAFLQAFNDHITPRRFHDDMDEVVSIADSMTAVSLDFNQSDGMTWTSRPGTSLPKPSQLVRRDQVSRRSGSDKQPRRRHEAAASAAASLRPVGEQDSWSQATGQQAQPAPQYDSTLDQRMREINADVAYKLHLQRQQAKSGAAAVAPKANAQDEDDRSSTSSRASHASHASHASRSSYASSATAATSATGTTGVTGTTSRSLFSAHTVHSTRSQLLPQRRPPMQPPRSQALAAAAAAQETKTADSRTLPTGRGRAGPNSVSLSRASPVADSDDESEEDNATWVTEYSAATGTLGTAGTAGTVGTAGTTRTAGTAISRATARTPVVKTHVKTARGDGDSFFPDLQDYMSQAEEGDAAGPSIYQNLSPKQEEKVMHVAQEATRIA
jgi:hypothetical protein